jgi:hypothetical protein
LRSPLRITPDGILSHLLLQRSPPSLLTIAACRGLRPRLTAGLEGPALISRTAPHLLLQKRVRDTPSRCHLSPRRGGARRRSVGERLAEFEAPLPDHLVRHRDAAGDQYLRDHAQAQREPKIQPYHVADDLRGSDARRKSGLEASSSRPFTRPARLLPSLLLGQLDGAVLTHTMLLLVSTTISGLRPRQL